MKKRQLLPWVEAGFGGHELEHVEAGQCPAMASNDRPQLALALRKRNVETAFSVSNASQQKLERQGGFASSRTPFDQINAIGVEAAAENVIEAGAEIGRASCRERV